MNGGESGVFFDIGLPILYHSVTMARKRKDELEKIADMILLDDAVKRGYVKGTGNKHGFGKYMRERGIMNPAWESEVAAHEKTGFSPEQLEEIARTGVDRQTRERYRKLK